MKSSIYTFLLLLLATHSCFAEVKLPALFSDGMVLQQKSNVKIWGTATLKNRVEIKTSWNNKSYSTHTDSDGKWSVKVETPGAGGPYSISIKQQNKIILQDVLIGEVWICSGQSNMDLPLGGVKDLPILNSNDILLESPNSRIRLFQLARKYATSPSTDVSGTWQQAAASSAKSFSAVGYQFATLLEKHLHVPIGIIQATWGGSPIEAWMDRPSIDEALALKGGLEADKAVSKANHQTPSNLFNAMIAPLIGYQIAGIIWYQGEQNRHNYDSYLTLQPAMVKSWRKHWGIGEWPFYYVQIAPMIYPNGQQHLVPLFREVQLKLQHQIPNTGMAVSIDAGEERNIHPADKTIIARRLAYWAIANNYQKTGIAFKSPEFDTMKIANGTASLTFKNCPLGITTYGKKITQFEIAGSDKVFYPATAEIKNNTVMVQSKQVANPVAVRYAFKDWAIGEIYSVEGIPASSFRTDNW